MTERAEAAHVVLIEDEANIAEAIRFVLGRAGLRVTVLTEGTGALARLRDLRPDLVILDLMLPGASGFEILQGIRAMPLLAGLPVMMLTAKGQARDREAAEQAGASLFMAKPFANAELLTAVQNLVRRK